MEPRPRKILILGASRGLGAQLVRAFLSESGSAETSIEILGLSRNKGTLEKLKAEVGSSFQYQCFDVAREESWERWEFLIESFSPHQIFYVAGGGPFGPFEKRAFLSHQWAWKVTFEGAARVCHWALGQSSRPQVVLVGSSICESKGDPQAASYAAAKHALKGLYESLRLEAPDWDLRLVSPGYLDTELLPKNAPVRYKEVWNPATVAQEIANWSMQLEALGAHKLYASYPGETERSSIEK